MSETVQKPKRAPRSKPRWKHVRWGLVGLIVVLVAALVAFLGVNRTVGLQDTLPSTAMPEFSQTMGAVPGWKVVPSQNPEKQTSYFNGSTVTNRIVYVKNDVKLNAQQTKSTGSSYYGTCYVTYQTLFIPSYLAGAGDDFLSQSFLYSQEASYNTVPQRQQTVTVSMGSGRQVAFRSAYYKADGKAGAQGSVQPYEGYLAVRGFDKVYTTPEKASEGQYGTKTNKVLPALVVSYSCTNGGKVDPKLWPKFLAAATILVK